MNTAITGDRRQATNSLTWAVLAVLAMVALLTYINASHMLPRNGELMEYLRGEVARPWAFRVLAPMAVRWIGPVLPSAIVQAVSEDPAPIGAIVRRLCPESPRYGLALLIVLYGSLLAALAGLDTLAADLGYPVRWRPLGLALLLVVLVLLFAPFAYIYDLPTLALFAWCYVFIQRGRYEVYLITFALATLSKETAVLLIPVYWLASARGPLNHWRAAEQLTVYGAGRLVLWIAFAGRPGGVVEWHLPDFLSLLPDPTFLFQHACYLLILLLACVGWQNKPAFLRWALLGTFPALAGLYLLFGFPGEFRVFLETAPIVITLLLPPGRPYANRSADVRPVFFAGLYGAYPRGGAGNSKTKTQERSN